MPSCAREVLADPAAVAHRAAEVLLETCAAVSGSERLAISLSGGSTPQLLYRLLATPAYQQRVPWQRVHWFWGDERFVPPDHPDSNYKMVRQAMLDAVPVAADHIHPMTTVGLTPQAAAADYEKRLQAYYGANTLDSARPLFDLTLLGLGDDGHTASLFPGVAALDERERWSAAVIGAKPEPRLSLTFPAINASRLIVVLVTGIAKQGVLRRLERGEDLPITRVKPSAGKLLWLIDEAAYGPDPAQDRGSAA